MTTQQFEQFDALIDQLDDLRDDVPDAEWVFMSDALAILADLRNAIMCGENIEEKLIKLAE